MHHRPFDWREAWIAHNQQRPAPADSRLWDERAEDFGLRNGPSTYARRFIELLNPSPGASILDIGCGNGALALPLARAGHEVLAVDFSPGMLEVLATRRDSEGLSNISTRLLSWDEDWSAAGIGRKCVDVAIASRSTMVADLHEAFSKMNRVACELCAVTMTSEFGPRKKTPKNGADDSRNTHSKEPADYIFGVNILLQMGLYPRLDYIDTEREGRLVRWAFLSWKAS
ncbi:MAG: class I SAM-dependent methyltransferase [Coriobacteriales bacterium]|jgi:SAM-dependent methyltransferase|nr:class I SAM-dependent methyltransferase [Coriobacteriales bacterium]